MKIISVVVGEYLARWRGGSVIPVWRKSRMDETVPDLVISFPASVKKSRADRHDIERIVKEWLEKNA